jgi:CrcB protein
MPRAHRRRVDGWAVAAVSGGALVVGPVRYAIAEWLPTSPHGVPWATLTVNVAGSFVLAALLVVVFESTWSVRYLREFAGVGVLGSFTTFSTFAVELHDQAAAAEWHWLGLYLVGTLVLGLAAAALGATAGRLATTRRRR